MDRAGLLPHRMRLSSLRRMRYMNSPGLPNHLYSASPGDLPADLPVESPQALNNDEEAALGVSPSSELRHRVPIGSNGLQSGTMAPRPSRTSAHGGEDSQSPVDRARTRLSAPIRRPSTVRVVLPGSTTAGSSATQDEMKQIEGMPPDTESTPLISAGVRPNPRKTISDADARKTFMSRARLGLGRMVELGLPLVMWVIEHPYGSVAECGAARMRSAGRSSDSGGWDILKQSDRR